MLQIKLMNITQKTASLPVIVYGLPKLLRVFTHKSNRQQDLVFFTPQLAGEARQLGCPKIVLGHMRVYNIYIYVTYQAKTQLMRYYVIYEKT